MRYASPIAALVAELLGKNRTSLLVTSIVAPVGWAVARAYFRTLPGPPSPIGDVVGFIMLVILAMQLAAIFAYVDLNAGPKSTGFPKHVLLLPLPTWLLAAVPIVAGSLFISAFVLLWLHFVSGVSLATAQQLAIAIAIASLMCWVQAISWELVPARVLRIVVLAAVVGAAILSVLSLLASEPDFLLGRARGAAGLALVTVGGFGLAYLAVIRARRGEILDLTGLLHAPLQGLRRLSGSERVPALKDAVAAQDWYEWRLYGRTLPTFIAVVAAGPLATVPFGLRTPSLFFPCVMLLVFVAFAPLMGTAYIAKNLDRRAQMGAFIGTRPLSDYEMGFAKLRLSLRSHLLSLALILAVIVVLVATSHNNAVLAGIWSRLTQQLGTAGAYRGAGVLLIVVVTTSWAWTAYFMSLQLLGQVIRTKAQRFAVSVMVTALFLGALLLARRIYEVRATVVAWLGEAHWQLDVPALVLVACGLCLVPRFRTATPLRKLTPPAAACAIGAALAIAVIATLHIPVGYQLTLATLVVTVAIMSFLPFVLVPILIDLNRHR